MICFAKKENIYSMVKIYSLVFLEIYTAPTFHGPNLFTYVIYLF